MRIGILTTGFINWQGGIDFLKNIIIGINAISKINNFEVTLCFEDSTDQEIVLDFTHTFKDLNIVKYKIIRELHTKFELDLLLPSIRIIEDKDSLNWIGYIPDCQHKYLPHFFSKREINQRDINFSRMINRAKLIIVNSKDTKKDLIKFYNAKDSQIISLPFAPLIEDFKYFENNKNLIQKYNLPKSYFLISNQFWLHKEHMTAFKALFLINNDVHIVCTGKLDDYRSKTYILELLNLIRELNLEHRIHFLGLVPKIDQIEIMKNSIALIQPTLFEGGPGGGSVYNAISICKKCIVSDIRINKEIINNNIVFFRAKNHKNLALKMKKLILENTEPVSKDILIEQQNYFLELLSNALKRIILSYKLSNEYYDKYAYINQHLDFSKSFNNFYKQILALEENTIIYGNGTIGKTIQALIPDKVKGYVDMSEENNHPKNLMNMKYDKIIISVLGREEGIIKYLIEELQIEKEKIITLEL